MRHIHPLRNPASERGGINIEHGQENCIKQNHFEGNACGIHLWWDADPHLDALPWVATNGNRSMNERVFGNGFTKDAIALQLRGPTRVLLGENRFSDVDCEVDATPDATVVPYRGGSFTGNPNVHRRVRVLPGTSTPVGRIVTAGRESIRVDEWGPIEPPGWHIPASPLDGN